jgi:acyl-CoA dehydrogenase
MELNIFNEEHDILRKTLRDFIVREVSPHIDEWNEAHATPRSIWKRLGELGCLGAYIPEEYGGYGSDFLTSVVLTEELVRSRCGGLSLDVSVSNDIAVPYLIEDGTEEQKKKYLPGCVTGDCIVAIAITEPNTGSDVAALRSTAVKDGDVYRINAQKTFITNGGHADLIVLAVKTDPKAKPAYAGVSLVLVEKGTAGFTVGRKLQKMGNPCSTTAELSFEDVRVPRANLLGEEGSGFKSIMLKFQRERLICAIMSLAYCELMLADTVQYTRERTAFGKSISGFQANKHKLVDMATEIEMSRCFVYHLSQLFNSGRQDIVKEISMAKFYVGELANRVAYDCVQLHGGYGYVDEYWICRAYQDVRMLTIAAGTTEIMKEIIAKEMGV